VRAWSRQWDDFWLCKAFGLDIAVASYILSNPWSVLVSKNSSNRGSSTNGNCEENPQHYYYIWNRVPKVMLLNKLQKFKGAFFLYCELYIGNIASLWCNNNVLLNCITINNKRRNNYQYFFSAINCSQPPVQLSGQLGIWMQHGDLKIFIMTHQHTEVRNNFPLKKTTNPHGILKPRVTTLHVLRNTRAPRNPCWRILT